MCSLNNWHSLNTVVLSHGNLGPEGASGIICGHFWLSQLGLYYWHLVGGVQGRC